MAEETKPPAPKPASPKAPAPPKPPAVMESVPWQDEFTTALRERFADRILETATYRDQKFIVAAPESVIPLLEYLRFEGGFDYLVDVTAVHWPKRDGAQFDLVYILYNFQKNERVRVKARIAEGNQPESAVDVYLTANWLEREVFDMFGIQFAHHPDLRRILMPEDWSGYPLRKDYSIIQMDQRWVKENLGIESGQ